MRLLKVDNHGSVSLTKDILGNIPPYAILSHTWGAAEDEVTFSDLQTQNKRWWKTKNKVNRYRKPGHAKIDFCAQQVKKDGLEYFWIDTCCINRANSTELSEAITSMFKWYQSAIKCYVYLSDVSVGRDVNYTRYPWESMLRSSRWFTRGWTLQELLSPKTVEFYSVENQFLGSKETLEDLIHATTQIPISALRGLSLSKYPVEERLRWAEGRHTTKPEDKAYCLFGIFGVFLPLIYGEGEHAFNRLKQEIDKHSDVSLSSGLHTHWMVTRVPNPFFTGRDDILRSLEQVIRDAIQQRSSLQQCRIVISGIGGQGKSEICLQLANRLRQLFWGIFWVDVSTGNLAERSFLDIADMISRPARSIEDARAAISNLKQPWLMILDNADDPYIDQQQYFPTGSTGVVILTSRNEECQQYATISPLALQGLSEDEAQQLLLKAALMSANQYAGLESDAKKVARLLQSHALAVLQAGAYISKGHCTLAEYPHIFEQQRKRLLEFRPKQAKSRYQDVYTTFEASAILLKTSQTEAAQDALQLLPLLAVCGPNRIPLSLFEFAWEAARYVPPDLEDDAEDRNVRRMTPWHVARLPSFVDIAKDSWDAFRLMEAVNLLKAFALVSTETYDRHLSVSMHPLVHAWARDRQTDPEQHRSWLSMACLLAFVCHHNEYRRQLEIRILPHVETLIQWDLSKMYAEEPPVLVTRALVQCANLLLDAELHAELYTLLQAAFARLQLNPKTVVTEWIGLYHVAGLNLTGLARGPEAISILKDIAEIQERSLAADNRDRLSSLQVLARAYGWSGRIDKAIVLLEEVVKVERQLLSEDHPKRLCSEDELAGFLWRRGDRQAGLDLITKVARIRRQCLREDHPDRLNSERTLAIFLWESGSQQAAFDLLTEVVHHCRAVLDERNSCRIVSEEWIELMQTEMDGQVTT